jgi:hypothetical protein
MSRFPAVFRPPAFASWPSCSRRGVGPPSRSAYRPKRAGPRRGYRVSHARATAGMGALSTPRTTVLYPTAHPQQSAPAALSAARPCTPLQHPINEAHDNEASTRVHAIHPSGFPLARGRPDGTSSPSAFPRASHPADQEPDNARRGGDRSPSTDLNTLYDISRTSNQRIYSKRATSCRTGDSC